VVTRRDAPFVIVATAAALMAGDELAG
jgi:hypothetical protein